MRTENQIKRKLNELIVLKQSVDERLAAARGSNPSTNAQEIRSLEAQASQLEELASLLEWVLNEPIGKYHA